MSPKRALARRLDLLESHLRAEHPRLLPALATFRSFDRLLQRMGLLSRADSLTSRIAWWPVISVLGLFSSGKSSFINSFLGMSLQTTGNQAVDDKFTVICYGPDRHHDSLPGTALNADPRFPFYRMSDEIERVAQGEGKRIDAYLQLKTASSPRLRGKILIDSPGFDADDQRRSTLRVTDHIMDLADLVLVMFDARRPEPGSMYDTLKHLVAKTVQRPDSRKFLYILNQIDTSAREDNPEAVVGAWQRAIAQAGLVSGRFYGIYNREVAPAFNDPTKQARYEAKSAADLAEIHGRITDVEFGRGYRIAGSLESLANELETEIVPWLAARRAAWRRGVLAREVLVFGAIGAVVGLLAWLIGPETRAALETWSLALTPPWALGLPVRLIAVAAAVFAVLWTIHATIRARVARAIIDRAEPRRGLLDLDARGALEANFRISAGLFRRAPVGWDHIARRRLADIRDQLAAHVQRWNDEYTDPAGRRLDDPGLPASWVAAAPPPPPPPTPTPTPAASPPPDAAPVPATEPTPDAAPAPPRRARTLLDILSGR